MACSPGLHPYASRLQPDCSLRTGGTSSCSPVCRRFGILTHHLAPIEEALRGAGLELEWSGAVHGGKSVPSAQATAMCGAAVLVVACRPVAGAAARCRWRMAAANPSRMSVGNLPTQAR